MRKKQLGKLVDLSYTKDELDEQKVDQITKGVKKKDLKLYIRALKNREKKKRVDIVIPTASVYNITKKFFFDAFPGKSIIIREDKLLLLGGKITADDMVYDFSLKKELEDFLLDVEENYDKE